MLRSVPVIGFRVDGGVAVGELRRVGDAFEFQYSEPPWISPATERFVRKVRDQLLRATGVEFRTRMEKRELKKKFERYVEPNVFAKPQKVAFRLGGQPGPTVVSVALQVGFEDVEVKQALALVGLGSEIAQELQAFSFENFGVGFMFSSTLSERTKIFRFINKARIFTEVAREKGMLARFGVALGRAITLRPGLVVSTGQPLAFYLSQADVDDFLGFLNLSHWFGSRATRSIKASPSD